MKTNLSEAAVKQIANLVMQGVANLFLKAGVKPIDYAKATQIIRDEIKAFLFAEEYHNERACLLAHSLDERTILMSVCLSAFNKIRAL